MATKKAVKPKKTLSVSKPFSKSELVKTIADTTGLEKKQAAAALESFEQIIQAHVAKKKGPGTFVFPGVAKFRVINKPATKARKGTNPFTGEPMTFAAKPARNIVRVKALKKLKDVAK